MNFEKVLNGTSSGIVIIDRSLKVTYANSAAEALFKVSRRQMQSRKFTELYRHCTMQVDNLDRVFVGQAGFTDAEVTFILEANERMLAEVNVNYSQDVDDKPLVIVEIHPVTTQRKLSEESQKQLLHNATKQLIRGLAHEIKNPLGGLRGAAQLLHRELPSESLQEYTNMIIDQADRLSVLVDRLLGPNHPSSFQLQNIHSVIEKTRLLALMGTET
ncbi:MAG: two-component system sensor histidine kinase NtrB, partial [Glaciecola sp.]